MTLGIIFLDPRGSLDNRRLCPGMEKCNPREPQGGSPGCHPPPPSLSEEEEQISRLETLHKADKTKSDSDSGNQHKIDSKMAKIVDKYLGIFQGIGKVKIKPIHLHFKDNNKKPIAQNPILILKRTN